MQDNRIDEARLRELIGELSELPIYIYDTIDSTNLSALNYANGGGAVPAVFIAEEQTAGRGRLGRSFLSPRGCGIYMSILTRVKGGTDPTAITTYAASAISRAIENETALFPKIKWVNDLYLGGKKLAGILTQGVIDPESTAITHAIMGVGINVLGDAPEGVRDIATTLETEGAKSPDRTTLIAAIIREYLGGLDSVGTKTAAEEYRRRSYLVGKAINVITPTKTYPATVIGITDEAKLELLLEDGTRELLSTGEVSVREIEKH